LQLSKAQGVLVKVSVNEVTSWSKEIQVEIPAEDVQLRVDEIYGKITQEAKLPGFRKGKVPISVIKKEYKSNVREEMIQHQLPDYLREALIDQKINPVTQPRITHLQFEEGAPLKFVASVEVKPLFELKEYKALKVKKESTVVGPEEVEETLETIRQQQADFIPAEDRAAKTDDLAVIDFEGRIEGKTFEGGKANRYPVLLGSASLLKDFEANLIGLKKGETKVFKAIFPQGYGNEKIQGKEAEFTVTLRELKEKKLPEMDDAFALKVGKFQTVQEMKERVAADLKSHREVEQRSKMIEQIAEKLMADHPLDVPASLVNLEQQRLIQQGVERLKNQGVDAGKWTEAQKKEFVDSLGPIAKKNVHMALLVEKISEAEKIRCEEKDYEAYLEKISAGSNQPPDAVKRYLQQQNRVESVKEWIQYEKTLDFLIASAKIEAA
jgi:trigger factor